MMPGMDGTELCKALRQNHSTTDTPIIMLTAKDDRETEMKSISCGADVFMPKPFNLQKLQLHMVQLLKRRNDIIKKIHINAIAEKPYEKEGYENNDERLIADVMKAINDNMAEEDFNVAKLCQLLNIDQKQLYRKLKKLTGKTPVSFIREQRLKRAANPPETRTAHGIRGDVSGWVQQPVLFQQVFHRDVFGLSERLQNFLSTSQRVTNGSTREALSLVSLDKAIIALYCLDCGMGRRFVRS